MPGFRQQNKHCERFQARCTHIYVRAWTYNAQGTYNFFLSTYQSANKSASFQSIETFYNGTSDDAFASWLEKILHCPLEKFEEDCAWKSSKSLFNLQGFLANKSEFLGYFSSSSFFFVQNSRLWNRFWNWTVGKLLTKTSIVSKCIVRRADWFHSNYLNLFHCASQQIKHFHGRNASLDFDMKSD